MANWRFIGLLSLVQWISFCFLPVKGNQARGGYPGVYHERQRRHLCLLHALNNLLQGERAFTRRELNEIADRLHLEARRLVNVKLWLRPYAMIQARIQKLHRHRFGDYDINVLIQALDTRNKEIAWMKQGMNPSSDEPPSMALFGDKLVGIILNKTEHWVAICKIDGVWYNLDSLLDMPLRLPGEERVKAEMAAVLANTGHVLMIVDKDA